MGVVGKEAPKSQIYWGMWPRQQQPSGCENELGTGSLGLHPQQEELVNEIPVVLSPPFLGFEALLLELFFT